MSQILELHVILNLMSFQCLTSMWRPSICPPWVRRYLSPTLKPNELDRPIFITYPPNLHIQAPSDGGVISEGQRLSWGSPDLHQFTGADSFTAKWGRNSDRIHSLSSSSSDSWTQGAVFFFLLLLFPLWYQQDSLHSTRWCFTGKTLLITASSPPPPPLSFIFHRSPWSCKKKF